MSETTKLLGSTKNKITKNKKGENLSYLEIIEVILFHYNIVNNDYQHNSRVLYTFVPNKWFGQSLDISPKKKNSFQKPLTQTFDILKYGILTKILNQ